jgi:hypothetical protein
VTDGTFKTLHTVDSWEKCTWSTADLRTMGIMSTYHGGQEEILKLSSVSGHDPHFGLGPYRRTTKIALGK